MQSAKDYFSNYLADDVVRQLNHDLVNKIMEYKPDSVFEFGTGQGKNLNLLLQKNPGLDIFGIDISPKALNEGWQKGCDYIALGDEEELRKMTQWLRCDVAFTCSVLDHIDWEYTAIQITKHLKRISKKAVILFETQRNTNSIYYYYHDYEFMGFTKLKGYEYYSSPMEGGDGSTYHLYLWERKRNQR